jgi:hypothetical protein
MPEREMDPNNRERAAEPTATDDPASTDRPAEVRDAVGGVLGAEEPARPRDELPGNSGAGLARGNAGDFEPEPAALERRAP